MSKMEKELYDTLKKVEQKGLMSRQDSEQTCIQMQLGFFLFLLSLLDRYRVQRTGMHEFNIYIFILSASFKLKHVAVHQIFYIAIYVLDHLH